MLAWAGVQGDAAALRSHAVAVLPYTAPLLQQGAPRSCPRRPPHCLLLPCWRALPPAAPQVKEEEQEAAKLTAVFPCVLKIIPTCIFNQKDPIILGVEVRRRCC